MVVGFPSVKTACYYSVVYGLSNSGRHTDTLKASSAAPTAAFAVRPGNYLSTSAVLFPGFQYRRDVLGFKRRGQNQAYH